MQQQNKFREQAKTAALDRWYRKRLKAVAKQIAQIALEWEGSDPSQLQLSLFDYAASRSEKQQKLDAALDDIRAKYGKDAVKRGSFV